MGVINFSIVLDSPTGAYYAGNNVAGKVILRLDKKLNVRGVRIKFVGFAHASWRKRISEKDREGPIKHRTVTYSAHEEYFCNKFYLIGSENGDIVIPAGDHNYTFNMTLPQNLPTSFEGKYGHVRYTVKATLDMAWKMDQETNLLFQVHNPLDLNSQVSAKMPIKRETHKNFCCCWCKSGPLTLVVFIPHSGFVPGEDIPLTVEVDNASNVDVEAVKIYINKVETFKSHSPKHDTKYVKTEVAKKALGGVEVNGSKTFTEAIRFPNIPFVNLKACSIINVDFSLKVEAQVSGACRGNLSHKIPLIIGTVAVYGAQDGNRFSPTNSTPSDFNAYNPVMNNTGNIVPPPLGFHPDGVFSPTTGNNIMPTPQNMGVGFNLPYPPAPYSAFDPTGYPQPIYPGLKITFPSPGESTLDLTASAPPLDSDSE